MDECQANSINPSSHFGRFSLDKRFFELRFFQPTPFFVMLSFIIFEFCFLRS